MYLDLHLIMLYAKLYLLYCNATLSQAHYLLSYKILNLYFNYQNDLILRNRVPAVGDYSERNFD